MIDEKEQLRQLIIRRRLYQRRHFNNHYETEDFYQDMLEREDHVLYGVPLICRSRTHSPSIGGIAMPLRCKLERGHEGKHSSGKYQWERDHQYLGSL